MPIEFKVIIDDIHLDFIKLTTESQNEHVVVVVPFSYIKSDGRIHEKSEKTFWERRINQTPEQGRNNHLLDKSDVEWLRDFSKRIKIKIMEVEGI